MSWGFVRRSRAVGMKRLVCCVIVCLVCVCLGSERTVAQTEYLNRDYSGGVAVGYNCVWTDDIPAFSIQCGASVKRLMDAGVFYSGSVGEVSSLGAFAVPWIRLKGYARHGASLGIPLSIGRTNDNGFRYTYVTAGIGISRRIQAEYSNVFWLLSGVVGVHYGGAGVRVSGGDPFSGWQVDHWWKSHMTGSASLGVGLPLGKDGILGISGVVGKIEGSPVAFGFDVVLVLATRAAGPGGS